MYRFTGGVNTHKGMIFSLGLLCGCAGWLFRSNGTIPDGNEICACVRELCTGLCEQDFAEAKKRTAKTKGETIYFQYGCAGARGQAQSGYAVLCHTALPVYTQLRQAGIGQNDAMVHTLLYLIREVTDTNIIARHDFNTASYAKAYAKEVLEQGGVLSKTGRAMIRQMDVDFIEKNISPGGCADLLALTHFLYRINETRRKQA